MTPVENIGEELEKLWHRGIPLTVAMQIAVESCSSEHLTVAADLGPNANVHGTAFAGSLYAIAALTGWGMVWLALRERGLDGAIVLARGEIDYRRPVVERIVCHTAWPAAARSETLDRLAATGRADCSLECRIGPAAARFVGRYSVR